MSKVKLALKVKGFEGELKQVLDKAVSAFSHCWWNPWSSSHWWNEREKVEHSDKLWISGEVSNEGLQKMKRLKKDIWLQDTSLKYSFINQIQEFHSIWDPLSVSHGGMQSEPNVWALRYYVDTILWDILTWIVKADTRAGNSQTCEPTFRTMSCRIQY